MNQIIGDVTILEAAKKSPLENKNVYINFDVLTSIPIQHQVVLSKVQVNFDTDFYEVGGNMFMPQPHIIKRIADACGISMDFQEKNEAVIQEVDYNRMLMAPIDAEPKMRKMVVGKSVTKSGSKKELDGTNRSSGGCTDIYNVWERCCEEWSKEEASTNGYDSSKVMSWPSGDRYFVATWKKDGKDMSKNIPLRYDTPHKRRLHFDTLMKFAHPICQTKAQARVIRTLTGIFLGYKKDDIPDGYLAFAKVIRSEESLKLDALARADALRHGIAPPAPTALLFGTTSQEPEPAEPEPEFPIDPEPEFEVIVDKRQELISVLKAYDIPEAKKKTVHDLIAWLERTPDAEQNERFWPNALRVLADVEKTIPEEARIRHSLGGQS